jgi:histidinol dehydrogenase
VPAAIEAQLRDHPRAAITRTALNDWGLIVVAADLAQAAALSDTFAPEHLELLVEDPEALSERIRHAGAIFLGPWSPEAVGDYLAGPNHTLPTSGTARFAGALGVETFLRHTSLIAFNRAALEATADAVITLAESEGLHSHAESVRRRLEVPAEPPSA